MDRKIVKIPKSIIEKLKPFGNRFIKVGKPIRGNKRSGKRAVENKWHAKPYAADDIELQKWLEHGGNYGIICGKGLYEIDVDDEKLQKKIEETIETFTVKTGRQHGRHYFIRSDLTRNGVIINENSDNLGNIQVRNKYVVGAGSNHYTGNKYEIIKDIPFAWVGIEQLEEIFREQLQWSKRHLSEQEAAIERKKMKSLGFSIPMTELVDISQLRWINVDELQGAHPIHGSESGINFDVNIKKNCWHCWRCNSGGGALLYLAMKHGLIKCHEAQKGVLRGKLWKRTIELALANGFHVDIEKSNISEKARHYFRKKKFIPARLAMELLNEFRYVTRQSDMTMYIYDPKTGTYNDGGEPQIMRQCINRLGEEFSRRKEFEVIRFVTSATIQRITETPSHLIAVKNGILNLHTMKLEPFTPEHFILNPLPVTYDSKAKCPKIMQFLRQIVTEEDIPVIQEFSGYCLHRSYPIHKSLMFLGDGANGKSTFLELLRKVLGKNNVSTVPLQSLSTQRFAISVLYGKLANIYPDLSNESLKDTGLFKMLSGGDTVSGEYKFKDTFDFKNYAKLLFSANKIPESKDDTTAFFRRWIIINFPNQFTGKKADKKLLEKLTTPEELSGFLNWILDGLQRLLENGVFIHSTSVEETRMKYFRSSDSIKAFVEECIEPRMGNNISKEEVYRGFIEYCKKYNIPSVSEQRFSRKLPEHAQTTSIRERINGKRTSCWSDIAMLSQVSQDYRVNHIAVQNSKKNKSSKLYRAVEKQSNLGQVGTNTMEGR